MHGYGMLFSMVLDLKDGRFVFECTYEERAVPKLARFWFDPAAGSWVTSSPKCAIRLLRYATEKARREILDKLAKPAYGPMERPKAFKRSYRYNT